MNKALRFVVLTSLALFLSSCSDGDAHDKHDHAEEGHPTEGPNGGQLLEVGSHTAHLEVLHDEQDATVTLHVLGPDGKTPMLISKPPVLKLSTDEGPRSLVTVAKDGTNSKSSVFTITDSVLRGEPQGRVTIEIEGKVYNPDFEHSHEDHDGHDHDDHDGHDH